VNVLTNVGRDTAHILSNILSPLEEKQHIHTTYDAAAHSFSADKLARLQMGFHLEPRDRKLQSRQRHGMIVDPDQTMSILVSLGQ
jgi:hypothetical protein